MHSRALRVDISRHAAAIVCAILASAAAFGQSHDRAHPTPLGPGINKANINSFEGPHYYYFFAGPGHIDVDFAFKESGLVGNPYRQLLNFDFLNEDGAVESHNHVTSFNDTARIHTDGDLTHRKRFVLRILPQPSLIKLGGYYEIAVAGGTVNFEGATVGGTVKAQQSESLIKPVGALVTSGGPLVTSGGPLITRVGPLLVAESAKDLRVTLPADILFDFNQAIIRSDATPALRQVATLIHDKSRGGVLIEGYTDSIGYDAYNLALSQQRAHAVADWLVRNASRAPSSFSIEAFGARNPAASNTNPDGSDNPTGRQRNRQVELVIPK